MKTRFFSFIFVILFALSSAGCDGNAVQDPIALPVVINATLEGTDAPFSAEITDSDAYVRFDAPHTLSGVLLYFSPEENRATVGEILDRSIKEGTFPAQEAFIKAVRAVAGIEKIENERKYTIDEMTVMVYYDKDNDRLTAIETEESGRRYRFVIHSLEPQ